MKTLLLGLLLLSLQTLGQQRPARPKTTAERLEEIRRNPPASQRYRQPPPETPPTAARPTPTPSETLAPPQARLAEPKTMWVVPPSATGKSATVFNIVGFDYLTCKSDNRCKPIDWIDKHESVQVLRSVCGSFANPGTAYSCDGSGGARYFEVEVQDEDGKPVKGFIQATYLTLVNPNPPATPPPRVTPPEPTRPPVRPPEAGVPNCKDCGAKTEPLRPDAIAEARRLADEAAKKAREEREAAARAARARPATAGSVGPGPVPDMGDNEKFNENCRRFIDEDGKLGEWGEIVRDAFSEVGAQCFMEQSKMASVCPKFSTFNPQKQMQFLNYALAAKAVTESSCEPAQRVSGITIRHRHGKSSTTETLVAVGLFQLEESAHRREDMNRDERFCRTGDSNVSRYRYDVTFQVECTLSTMKNWMCDRGRTLTANDGYWQELRGANRKISKLIKRFPGCK